ncbi:HAMP domain-containing protein [Clostridium sp. P21]|uniref:histidine kinase n=1 Tax=Clostridium muellerianum TaxID=2716538 RepID=A0A7Y0EIA0_9CLOT|nr:histidine kinase dimerization/phospho-acceptor domain-containing protein [Clostridium muellerianum]NMM62920.1 HAMP domain-containing protein [Clostridium muellerianum]
MIKSIRAKLFMFITLLLICFISLIWILNSMYLEKYYINKKKNILKQNANTIVSMYKGNISSIQNELDRIANITGSNIDIRDKNGKIIYMSARRPPEEKNTDNNSQQKPPPDKPRNLDDYNAKAKEYPIGKISFENRMDVQMKIEFLTLVVKLSNEDIMAIRVPIVSIKESVDIANRFVIIIGSIIIFLGSIGAYLFSRKFTKPILEVNNIARNMAKFDFSQKCSISGSDEIGQLGQSVNYLSEELDTAITELNIKNKKLEEDIEKERKIDEMRKEFISSVSHELRTPLSLIQGYAEGLISNVNESEEDRNFYCDVIMQETIKMNKLVRDLLNLSQIESGYFQIEKSEFDIIHLIKYVLTKYKSIFTEKGIEVQTQLDESYIVYGDMVRIEQVLTNYINNAINHIDENRVIKITSSIDKSKIRVSIFNTGKHIPEDSLKKLWNSFYKVDKARTRAYGGYGLGLSIVKAIQDLHKSGYGVENVESGVSFWFEIGKKKSKDLTT